MTEAVDGRTHTDEFRIEEMSTGVFGSGFGQVGDGRTFSFQTEPRPPAVLLTVAVYRAGLLDPVPQEEDVVATLTRDVGDIDLTCERSLGAAVRDAVAVAGEAR